MTKDMIYQCLCTECDEDKITMQVIIKNEEDIKLKEKNRLHYLKHKEKISERYKEKKAKLIADGIIKEKTPTRIDGKIRKEVHKVYNDNYTNKNKDRVITCECGIEYKFFNKCQHLRSKKHKENMSEDLSTC